MACGIYKITNQINGKVYIGQSINIEDRWKQHLYQSKKEKTPLYQDMIYYGEDAFKFEIIEECLKKDLNKMEKYYISLYESYPPDCDKGYNQTPGGGNSKSTKGQLTDEYLISIINELKNSKISMQDIAKKFQISESTISNINKGKVYFQDFIDYPIRKDSYQFLKDSVRNLDRFWVKNKRKKYKTKKKESDLSQQQYCCVCGKELKSYSTTGRCLACHNKITWESRKFPTPPKEEILKSFYELRNCQKVADKFEISTVLLKKWRKELDLPDKVKDTIKLYEREYLGIVEEEKVKKVIMQEVLQLDKNTRDLINIFKNPIVASKHIKENYQPNNSIDNISSCIYSCLKGQIKTACGFIWQYRF